MASIFKQALYIIMLSVSSIGLTLNLLLCLYINLRQKKEKDNKMTTYYLLGSMITSLAYLVEEATKISLNCEFYHQTRAQCMRTCPQLTLLTLGEPMGALAALIMAVLFYTGYDENFTSISRAKRTALHAGPILAAIFFALTTWVNVALQRQTVLSGCCNVFAVWTKHYYRGYYTVMSIMGYISVALFITGILKRSKHVDSRNTANKASGNVQAIIVLCSAVGLHAIVQNIAAIYSKRGYMTNLLLRHVWVIDALSFTFYPLYYFISEAWWKVTPEQDTIQTLWTT